MLESDITYCCNAMFQNLENFAEDTCIIVAGRHSCVDRMLMKFSTRSVGDAIAWFISKILLDQCKIVMT